MDEPQNESLSLYLSAEHPCGYLPRRQARSLFVDPDARLHPGIYGTLLAYGFRRSGGLVYRPRCDDCQACVPVRVPVARFRPRRSQRRVWKQTPGLQIRERAAIFHPEHYRLYCRYILDRHPDGEMATLSEQRYLAFLTCDWCDTRFVEFRLADGRLLAVAVTDWIPGALSAVYTFFDPDLARLSPGVLAILWQIQAARDQGRTWLYLGYWVAGCRKMRYKTDYRPIQTLRAGRWREWGPGQAVPAGE